MYLIIFTQPLLHNAETNRFSDQWNIMLLYTLNLPLCMMAIQIRSINFYRFEHEEKEQLNGEM